ncbi:MAG: ABC transporter permease [Thermoleophilia bacterium]
MEGDVTYWGLAASLLLVVVAIAVSRRYGLGLELSMAGAALRATVQLVVVGAALGLVIDEGRPIILSWLWVAGIVLVASWVVRRRAPELPGVFMVALAANLATTVVSAGLIFGLGIFPLEGRALIPVMGMTLGNALTSMVVAATLLVREISDRRDDIEARLALGLPWQAATRPHQRDILRAAIGPQVERTRHVGTVFLPGAMVGLILAGVEPLDAVLVQGALMFVILGGVATSTAVVTLGATRRLFTADHRLRPLVRSTGTAPEDMLLERALGVLRPRRR